MVRLARSRRRVLVLPLAVSAMVLVGTGSVQAVMLSGDGLGVVALDADRNLDGVNRAAYLTVSPSTAVETATTDDDPPFLCQRTTADIGDD